MTTKNNQSKPEKCDLLYCCYCKKLKGHKDTPESEYKLEFCETCDQMTNHLKGVCQKHAGNMAILNKLLQDTDSMMYAVYCEIANGLYDTYKRRYPDNKKAVDESSKEAKSWLLQAYVEFKKEII